MRLYYFFIFFLTEIALCREPDEETTTNHIVFSNKDIKISGGSAFVNDTAVVIPEPGSFLVTGESDEGNIVIKASPVTLFLYNLYLSSEKTAPIIVTGNLQDVRIYALKNTTLNDLENKTTTDGECAVVKIKKSSIVYFKNQDIFEMNGECRDVIKGGSETKVIFEQSNGVYKIHSQKSAIDSDGLLEFKGGIFKIESENGDAIKSSPSKSDTESLGIISITDGDFRIISHNDAFTAKNNIIIKNGIFNIRTENGFKSKTFNKEAESAKGFKLSNNETGCGIYIYSGKFNLNTSDDAFHSNGDLTILAGKFQINTKDDAICSKKDLVLGKKNAPNDELQILVENSYEALEGVTITIYSGKIKCNSKDDGMNSSGDKQEEIDKDNKKREQERNRTNNNNSNRPGRNDTNRNRTSRNDSNWNWPNGNGSNWNWPNGNGSNWNWPNGNGSNWNFPNGNGSNWNWPNGNGSNWNWPNGNGSNWPNGNGNGNGNGQGWNWGGGQDWDKIRREHITGPPNDRYIIRIYGGDVFIETNSDGIDSNGHIYIHGGSISVFSARIGYNEPIDLSGNLTIFNAEVLAVGAGGVQLGHDALKKGNQLFAFHDGFHDGNVPKNTKLEIRDENDKLVKEGNITKDVDYLFYTSPLLNENYHFYIIDSENKKEEIKFEFRMPEGGLDDQDMHFNNERKKEEEQKNEEQNNEKGKDVDQNNEKEKEEDNNNYSSYLKILLLGINLLLL